MSTKRTIDNEAGADSAIELQIRVRYAECDPMGYLHHAKYAEFFEMGRTELLRRGGLSYRDMESAGTFLVVARMDIHYRSPARYDDVLTLKTRLRRMTRARIEHEYAVTIDGRLVCEASTTLACVDAHGQLQPIPDAILSLTSQAQ